MVTAIVQHEVKDFDSWRVIFDGDEADRAKAGVKLSGLYRSVKNPNEVTIIFEAPNAELYDTMMSDPGRQKKIEEAGVITKPTATILNKV